MPVIACGGGSETTVDIKCLIAVSPGSSFQSQEQQRAAGLVCLGATGVGVAAMGCGGQLVAVGSGVASLGSTEAQLPHTPGEEIATKPLDLGCSSSKGLVET